MADATDFMTFLTEHQGSEVMIEVGMPADDLDHHSRRLAKYHGRLGAMCDIDDADRPGRAIGWVPIGDEGGDRPLMGFFSRPIGSLRRPSTHAVAWCVSSTSST
jgi:hypothetical protein